MSRTAIVIVVTVVLSLACTLKPCSRQLQASVILISSPRGKYCYSRSLHTGKCQGQTRTGHPKAILLLAWQPAGKGGDSSQIRRLRRCLPARALGAPSVLWVPPSVLETPSRGPCLNPSGHAHRPSALRRSVGAGMICPWLSIPYSLPFTECT